jgi:uncharacterized repeat protein (TIGR04052 family)
MTRFYPRSFAAAMTTLALLSACGAPAGVSSLEASETQAMRIQFTPEVNGAPFRCDQTYPNVGTSKSTLSPKDFRMYVNSVELLNAKGEAIPMTLAQDGLWQHDNLALLDFEDKTGGCESGTTDTRFEVTGTVPKGEYTGVRFNLGVPFEMNHQDASQAPSPLNVTSMFWVWRYGYKFTRIDFGTTAIPQGYFIHLGSTGCTGVAETKTSASHGDMHVQHEGEDHGTAEESNTTAPLACSAPNQGSITLTNFNPETDTIVADLGELLKETDVDVNMPDTASGCMSTAEDSDCKTILPALGVAFDGIAPQQHFFKVRK